MVSQKAKKFSLLRRHEHAAYFREIRHVVIVSSFRNLRFQIHFSISIFNFNFPFTVFAFRLVLYFLFINQNSLKPFKQMKTKTLENLSIEPCQGSMALMGASPASRDGQLGLGGLGSRAGLRVGGGPFHRGLVHKIPFCSPVAAQDPCPSLSVS